MTGHPSSPFRPPFLTSPPPPHVSLEAWASMSSETPRGDAEQREPKKKKTGGKKMELMPEATQIFPPQSSQRASSLSRGRMRGVRDWPRSRTSERGSLTASHATVAPTALSTSYRPAERDGSHVKSRRRVGLTCTSGLAAGDSAWLRRAALIRLIRLRQEGPLNRNRLST